MSAGGLSPKPISLQVQHSFQHMASPSLFAPGEGGRGKKEMRSDVLLFSHNINVNSQQPADPIFLSRDEEIGQMVIGEFKAQGDLMTYCTNWNTSERGRRPL